MGLTFHDAKRLWEARLSGDSFENILFCSRLQLFLHPAELDSLRKDYRKRSNHHNHEPLADYQFGEYADRFCREFLGTNTLETLDYSSYEGASIVHDLNQPVPEALHQRFDAVIEAGSLEHIFNFPVAVRNLMMMAKVGGKVFLTTVANNFCGHGFYQFSPELIYRIFSLENGFETISVVFLEATFFSAEAVPIRTVYQVFDPMKVRARVGLVSGRPILMMVDTKKLSNIEPFATTPQQSDYVAAWEKDTTSASSNGGTYKTVAKQILKALPAAWQQRILGYRSKSVYSLQNKAFYRKAP